jgi:translation initiation factor 4A
MSRVEEKEVYEFTKWEDLELPIDLLRGIYAYGFENPSPIQSKAILPIIKGKDVIAQSQSGTGKTATFAISALSLIDLALEETQIMILSPTRELSKQSANVVMNIGSMMKGLKVQTLVGGTSTEEDAQQLKNNIPHVIVGCPGRIFHFIRKRHINAEKIKLVIFDEADEMLSSGFKEQVYKIFQNFNENVQVALFSATLPFHVNKTANKFMRDPINIFVKTEQLTLEGIKQYFVAIEDDRQKYSVLKDLYTFMSVSQCIIYCNSVKRVADLCDAMIKDGFPVCCIHSNMDKSERDKAYMEFRNGTHRVLISSNVTARGIDIQQVSVVINFDISKCVHTYLHRIGRSGRWGRKGVGINFVTRRDIAKIQEIEKHYSTQIIELPGDFDKI